MQSFQKSFDHLVSANPSQLILGVIFSLYILLNVQTPAVLADLVDTLFGKVLVVVIAGVLFLKTNPVVGVLGFVVAYQLIKTASVTTGTYAINHYLPSEESKMDEILSFNPEEVEVPKQAMATVQTNEDGSLEAEMVAQMAPLVMHGGDSELNYSPVLDTQHSAASLDEA